MSDKRERILSIALGMAMTLATGSVFGADSETPAAPEAASEEKSENPIVVLKTSMGDIELEIYQDKAPISAKNFLTYVKEGFYAGTIFHRVIPKFMIQGGGYTEDMNKKETRDTIKNEAKNGLKNDRGTLAMARLNVPDPDTATAQFYINHKDNDSLNHVNDRNYGYAVFGKVVKGMDVVDAIADVKTGAGDVPVVTVKIESVEIKKDEAPAEQDEKPAN